MQFPPRIPVPSLFPPSMVAGDAGSARAGDEAAEVSEVQSSMQRPSLTGHDGGLVGNDDARAWANLAAQAAECFSLELSYEAYDAMLRIEAVTRRAAGLPPQTRRRLRSA